MRKILNKWHPLGKRSSLQKEKEVGVPTMLVRLLTSLTIVALLWTGTLWHDLFGTEILPQLTHVSASFPHAADLKDAHSIRESCPIASHVHSPGWVSRLEDPTVHLAAVLAFVLAVESCFSLLELLIASRKLSRDSPGVTFQPKSDIFILNRALLI